MISAQEDAASGRSTRMVRPAGYVGSAEKSGTEGDVNY